ncbi:MAG: hypothetical protein MZV64_71540 [Ignavibacteriales bacterium]|nr:hypothetical protein [Ignavibacteriales bacterium]
MEAQSMRNNRLIALQTLLKDRFCQYKLCSSDRRPAIADRTCIGHVEISAGESRG